MRIAIIADIHGNLVALNAALADIEAMRPDRLVCLGDVAATGPQPRETVARLRALSCPVVMGNADAWLLSPHVDEDVSEDTRKIQEIDAWCAARLAPADFDYLRAFTPTVELPLGDGATLLCFHGSPRSYDDIIRSETPEDDLAVMLGGYSAAVLAGYWATIGGLDPSGELIAWCAILSDGVRHAVLLDVIVHPRHQGRGVGRALVARAVAHIRTHGITIIHVDFLPERAAFYERCGFRLGLGGIYTA